MLASMSFAVKVSSLIIFLMASDHATNLFSGRQIKRRRKSTSHPRITFCSSRRASDSSLFLASIVSRGIGSFSCSGREHVSKARRGAITSNNVVRPFYVHCQRNKVVDVVVGCTSWIDVNFDNQLEAFSEWDRVIYIWEEGLDVGLFHTASMGPNCHCVFLLS